MFSVVIFISLFSVSTHLVPKYVLHAHDYDIPKHIHDGNDSDSTENTAPQSEDHPTVVLDEVEEVDNYTNHDLVEKAFQECDINHKGLLNYEEFKMWIERNPALLDHIESILPYSGSKDDFPHLDKHDKHENLPHAKKPHRHSLSLVR